MAICGMAFLPLKKILYCIVLVYLWQISFLPADVATLQLPPIFSDNMVLQRNQPNSVWGRSTPRLPVRLALEGRQYITTADDEGRWLIRLPPLKATSKPLTMTLSASNTICLHNVLVGDVWLCCGQSNMCVPLSLNVDSAADIENATDPSVRFFSVGTFGKRDSERTKIRTWAPISPQCAGSYSALAYYFARHVHVASKVPIGIIQCGAAGLPLKAWVSKDLLGRQRENFFCEPGSLFEKSVLPLIGFGLKGIIWYQGESDIFGVSDYRRVLAVLINDWRKRWGQGSFPFVIVQLPNFSDRDEEPTGSAWAELREAQSKVASSNRNVWLIVTTDTVKSLPAQLHPKDKRLLGERIATLVTTKERGESPDAESPAFANMLIQKDKAVISFNPTQTHLVIKGPQVLGFSIAGENKKFYWAQGTITSNNSVSLWSGQVPVPIAVRYNWADNPNGNLYNSIGLPVAPFRTDSWTLPPVMSRYNFAKYLFNPEL